MSGERVIGRVRFFSVDKGFGFIIPDEEGPEVFVHTTGLARSLSFLITDQRVSYEVVDTSKGTGKAAKNVEVLRE